MDGLKTLEILSDVGRQMKKTPATIENLTHERTREGFKSVHENTALGLVNDGFLHRMLFCKELRHWTGRNVNNRTSRRLTLFLSAP